LNAVIKCLRKVLLYYVKFKVTQVDDTTYNIFAPHQGALDEAKELIAKYLSDEKEPQLEFGGIYTATIVEIRDSGVMVTLHPTMQPVLLHNSQLDQRRVSNFSCEVTMIDSNLKPTLYASNCKLEYL
jgi:polyribonucleotide nucleotidyltransferase